MYRARRYSAVFMPFSHTTNLILCDCYLSAFPFSSCFEHDVKQKACPSPLLRPCPVAEGLDVLVEALLSAVAISAINLASFHLLGSRSSGS